MWPIEPVFANITSNEGLSKLSLRGKSKVIYYMDDVLYTILKSGGDTGAMLKNRVISTCRYER